jgi:hypothetical protein
MRLNVMSWEIPKQLASVNWILGLLSPAIEECDSKAPVSDTPTSQAQP